eukprot:TRINITY_DN11747_c0_g4_i2.p1 TRINITY_DN11747_c0_g4~~TRINITY_DN11747_c0_g4_i2.p1  ORF type:complete len:243 (+),score=81.11 TRINITY_DN11747_c0_g4_i2:79-807(+)
MSGSTFYLEQYLDSLEDLPNDLKSNFNRMHDLDKRNRDIMISIDSSSDEYLRKVRDLSPAKRKVEMEKIQKMFKKAKEISDDKVKIAIQTYELVDKHIRRLDSDLAKFESEMKEKGRLSQTESEEEPEDDKRDKKKNVKDKKKKGRDDDKKKKKNVKNQKADFSSGQSSGNIQVATEVLDMPVDPNEPTYCTCQQVSYGEMIGCDNQDCPIEWFHFGCMKLTTKPKGKWYCPKCTPLFRKKK